MHTNCTRAIITREAGKITPPPFRVQFRVQLVFKKGLKPFRKLNKPKRKLNKSKRRHADI